jgi:putative transposase
MQSNCFYRRKLPHYQPADATFHVVFRLAGSVPGAVIEKLRSDEIRRTKMLSGISCARLKANKALENRCLHLKAFEEALHSGTRGPTWLSNPIVAGIVVDSLHFYDNKLYDLVAHTIMPNHVHLVIQLGGESDGPIERNSIPLYRILQSIKRYTARRANQILCRVGQFWQPESYDHVIRNGEELERTIDYILHNPVKAGLVRRIEEWPWSYCKFWNDATLFAAGQSAV